MASGHVVVPDRRIATVDSREWLTGRRTGVSLTSWEPGSGGVTGQRHSSEPPRTSPGGRSEGTTSRNRSRTPVDHGRCGRGARRGGGDRRGVDRGGTGRAGRDVGEESRRGEGTLLRYGDDPQGPQRQRRGVPGGD